MKNAYVYDAHGSVVQMVDVWQGAGGVAGHSSGDSSGNSKSASITTASVGYTPFGEVIGEKRTGFGFSGEWYDAMTGMQNLRARQYEPAMARFSQKDLLRGYEMNPASQNRYVYTKNDPVNYCDPSGMARFPAADHAGAFPDDYGSEIVTIIEHKNGKVEVYPPGSKEAAQSAEEVLQARKAGLYSDFTQNLAKTNPQVEAAVSRAMSRIMPYMSQEEIDRIFAEECWNVTAGYEDYWNRKDGYFENNWGHDSEKKDYALDLLMEEAEIFRSFNIGKISSEEQQRQASEKIRTVQLLLETMLTGKLDPEATEEALRRILYGNGDATLEQYESVGVFQPLTYEQMVKLRENEMETSQIITSWLEKIGVIVDPHEYNYDYFQIFTFALIQQNRHNKPKEKGGEAESKKPDTNNDTGNSQKRKITIDDKQLGKKIGKHAKDYGLNPSDPNAREFLRKEIERIFNNPSEVRQGAWKGAGEKLPDGNRATADVKFYIQGEDVVITDLEGNFITIMKDGVNNLWVAAAPPIEM